MLKIWLLLLFVEPRQMAFLQTFPIRSSLFQDTILKFLAVAAT